MKRIAPEICHLVECRQGKSSYNIFWGVSLTLMPHAWEKKLKLHRTLKSARFDSHEAALDYVVDCHASWEEVWSVRVDAQHGAGCFRADLERVWGLLAERIGS